MARANTQAARGAAIVAADEAARAIPAEKRPARIEAARAERERLHGKIAALREQTSALSHEIRALEDLEEITRAIVRVKGRRSGSVVMQSAPASVAVRIPKRG